MRIVVEFAGECAVEDVFSNASTRTLQSTVELAWDVVVALLLVRELVPALAPIAHFVAYEIDRIHFQLG